MSASKQTVNELAVVKFGITLTERSHGAVEGVSGDATNRLERGEPQEREDQGTRYDKGATQSTFRTTSTPTKATAILAVLFRPGVSAFMLHATILQQSDHVQYADRYIYNIFLSIYARSPSPSKNF
jgi:hypothetical protein